MLTQRESVDTSQGLDVPTRSSSQAPSQKGTSGLPIRSCWTFPRWAEMGRVAGPPSDWTLLGDYDPAQLWG